MLKVYLIFPHSVMIPFWTLTLGQALSIIQTPLNVDYGFFAMGVVYLLVPMFLGTLISLPFRRCFPCFTQFIKIILRILSPIYFFCIICYAFLGNVDMFMPFNIPWWYSWKVGLLIQFQLIFFQFCHLF